MPKPKTSARKPAAGKTSLVPSAPSVPASSLEVFTPEQRLKIEDTELASQLREQYGRAIGGMREVLKFGAMLMKLREKLETGPHADQFTGGRGKQGGIRQWLRENCPEISHSTAYRFLGIAEAVEGEYRALVGVRVAKSYPLPDLVAADPRDLPEGIKEKQLELFEFVDGTSQRSWLLDSVKVRAPQGGPRQRDPNKPQLSAEEMARQTAQILWITVRDGIAQNRLREDPTLVHLPLRTSDPAKEVGLLDLQEEVEALRDQLREAIKIVRRGEQI